MVFMIFRRIKSDGLAHLSYFIGSGEDAVVIDPRRDVDVYLDLARKNCMAIRSVLETHRNEDYVIGSLELKARTGCAIYHGKNAPFKYGEGIADGAELRVGDLRIRAIETPGHTPDSLTYVLYDIGVPLMAFAGDALFFGTTGRADLWGRAGEAAGALYDSIMNKILPLGDAVILCPAHGAGSVCGTGFSDRDDGTLGGERLTNPDLQLSREDFIAKKKAEPLELPYYFRQMEVFNLNGPPVTGGLPACPPLAVQAFEASIGGGILIDARMPPAFSAHVPGAYNIWLDGMATWPGWVADYDKPIYLLLEKDEDVKKATRYLYRLGFDNVKGYLCGGFQQWQNAGLDTEFLGLLVPDALAGMLAEDKVTVLDVRSEAEWRNGRIKEAMHTYLGELEKRVSEVPKGKPVACICSTGLRAGLAASILKKAGFEKVYNVLGGITAWKAKDYPLLYEKLLEK
jgi:hydroxyacylglutathione hydrolase